MVREQSRHRLGANFFYQRREFGGQKIKMSLEVASSEGRREGRQSHLPVSKGNTVVKGVNGSASSKVYGLGILCACTRSWLWICCDCCNALGSMNCCCCCCSYCGAKPFWTKVLGSAMLARCVYLSSSHALLLFHAFVSHYNHQSHRRG